MGKDLEKTGLTSRKVVYCWRKKIIIALKTPSCFLPDQFRLPEFFSKCSPRVLVCKSSQADCSPQLTPSTAGTSSNCSSWTLPPEIAAAPPQELAADARTRCDGSAWTHRDYRQDLLQRHRQDSQQHGLAADAASAPAYSRATGKVVKNCCLSF